MSRLFPLVAALALAVCAAHPAPALACSVDADCTASQWCDPTGGTCQGKLTNGSTIPNVAGHNPPLTGTCTFSAATAVCLSGVCDGDNRCGYNDGDGPCTAATGAVVCRSTACSQNGLCEPTGGCNVDVDCSGSQWCNEGAHACASKLPNGAPIPTDLPHTSPMLNGTCTAAAGLLVCQSGVCDVSDNGCGYADGDGPCNAGNGSTVCRSATCSVDGTCRAADGCNEDADCSSGNVCSPTHVCVPAATPTPTATPTVTPTPNGFIPPDDDTLGCQKALDKALGKLAVCLRSCHVQAASAAFHGKPFDETGCATTTPKKSCRAKFDQGSQKLVAKGTCPACLDGAHQAALADRVTAEVESETADLFCAGSVPLP